MVNSMLRFTTRELLLVLVIVAIGFGWLADRWQRRAFQKSELSDITEAQIAINPASECSVSFLIHDRELIQRLIRDPLATARREEGPITTYVVLGHMVLKNSDDEVARVVMFLPVGHIRVGDNYYTADFSALRDYLLTESKRTVAELERMPAAEL